MATVALWNMLGLGPVESGEREKGSKKFSGPDGEPFRTLLAVFRGGCDDGVNGKRLRSTSASQFFDKLCKLDGVSSHIIAD